DILPDSQGGLGSIGPLGIAYDPTRDKLYVSFCASGCKDGAVGGIVDSLDPTQLLTEPSVPFIFGLLTYSVPTTDLSDSDLTLLFRTSAFLTGGLAYDPAHDSLWVGSADIVREMDFTGNVLSSFVRPIPAGFTEGGFVDGLEFITSPPTFTLPNPVVEATGPSGAVVNFTVTAKNDDGDATVS